MSWRRFLGTFLAVLGLGGTALIGALVISDPYGSGRYTWISRTSVPPLAERFAVASVGRNPAFDSAIIGNSTSLLLDPARLSKRLDGHFAHLGVSGAWPEQELLAMEWFRRHHAAGVKYIVLGIDRTWCASEPDQAPLAWFPSWLYGTSALDYLAGLPSMNAVRTALRRLVLLLGGGRTMRADGVSNYEVGRHYDLAAARARIAGSVAALRASDNPAPPDAPAPAMPAFGPLRRELSRFDPATRKILVFLPVHASTLPLPGTYRENEIRSCKAAAHAVAFGVPNTVIVDLMTAGPGTDRDDFWWDEVHFRAKMARLIEDRLGAAISAAASASAGETR